MTRLILQTACPNEEQVLVVEGERRSCARNPIRCGQTTGSEEVGVDELEAGLTIRQTLPAGQTDRRYPPVQPCNQNAATVRLRAYLGVRRDQRGVLQAGKGHDPFSRAVPLARLLVGVQHSGREVGRSRAEEDLRVHIRPAKVKDGPDLVNLDAGRIGAAGCID